MEARVSPTKEVAEAVTTTAEVVTEVKEEAGTQATTRLVEEADLDTNVVEVLITNPRSTEAVLEKARSKTQTTRYLSAKISPTATANTEPRARSPMESLISGPEQARPLTMRASLATMVRLLLPNHPLLPIRQATLHLRA